MNLVSEQKYQENVERTHREVAFHQLNLEIGSLTVAALQNSGEQQMPLTDAITKVLESNK